MEALPNDFARVRESLADLRVRFPAAAMDGLDQLMGAYLGLLREDPASAETGGARQGALWAARRVLLRFFPTSRAERDGDDGSPEALAAYAGFARALGQQAQREGDRAGGVVAELILEWLDMLRGDPGSPGSGQRSRVEWDLPHLARVVGALERLFQPWLPHLRQQVFRVRGGPAAPALRSSAALPHPAGAGTRPASHG